MANLNKVMLIGNLTRDPELRVTPKGTAICTFSLAVNRKFRDESGAHFNGHPGRDDWLAARLEEGALWEQLHRVRSHPYVEYGPGDGTLRVV